MAAAGTAGAAAVNMAGASPAAAAAGGNMILGASNDAGSASTSLASTAASGTLRVAGSVGPAVQATGQPVPAGGAVAAAGHGSALRVEGVAAFTRSGTAAIFAPSRSIEVPVAGGLTNASHVLAMAQTLNADGQCYVVAARPNPTTGRITIYLNGPPAYAIKVAWFVFG
jgi:hypothetical protein